MSSTLDDCSSAITRDRREVVLVEEVAVREVVALQRQAGVISGAC